jgi:UPF0716 protein FxsA
MRRWPFVVLVAIVLLEAALLAWLGTMFGFAEVVLIVVLTALVGGLLVRAEGRRKLRGIRRSLAAGEPPTDELLDGGLLIVAGLGLLTPGILTDAIGLLFVLPVTRVPIRWGLKRWVVVPLLDERTGGMASGEVYTGGFPEPEGSGSVDPEDFDLGGGSAAAGGGSSGSGDGPGAGGASGAPDDVVDLDRDADDDGDER